MVNIMRFKVIYFIFSLLIILPGLWFLWTSGLKLGIDFSGGALLEYRFEKVVDEKILRETIVKDGIEVGAIATSDNNTYIIRTKPIDQSKINSLKTSLEKNFGY